MAKMKSKIFALLSSLVTFKVCNADPIVCVPQGSCYKGSYLESYEGRQFSSFQGIRYAEPPIGELRFKAPQPYNPGEVDFDVSKESTVICVQEVSPQVSQRSEKNSVSYLIYPSSATLKAEKETEFHFFVRSFMVKRTVCC